MSTSSASSSNLPVGKLTALGVAASGAAVLGGVLGVDPRAGAAVGASLTNLCGGVFGNLIADLFSPKLKEGESPESLIKNHDLRDLVGQAIKATILLQPETGGHVKTIADAAPELWMHEATAADDAYAEIDEPGVVEKFITDKISLRDETALDPPTWRRFVDTLCDVKTEVNLDDAVRDKIAGRLHESLFSMLRAKLKEDFTGDAPTGGRGYASLQLVMLGRILGGIENLLQQPAESNQLQTELLDELKTINARSPRYIDAHGKRIKGMRQLSDRDRAKMANLVDALDRLGPNIDKRFNQIAQLIAVESTRASQRHEQTTRGINRGFLAVGLLVVLAIGGGIWWVTRSVDDAVDKVTAFSLDPVVIKQRMREHLEKTAEQKIEALRDEGANWRKIAEIERRRDQNLKRLDDLIANIEKQLGGDAEPIFRETVRILQEDGVEEAMAYLKSKQTRVVNRAMQLAESRDQHEAELRKTLLPLLLEAQLRENNYEPGQAFVIKKRVAALAPDWSRVRNQLGVHYLFELQWAEAAREFQAALAVAEDDTQRRIASSNLGVIYIKTNRLRDAERVYRDLIMDLENAKDDGGPLLCSAMNNLALVLDELNEVVEAEDLFRRALAIDEQKHGAVHLDVARDLTNLANLLHRTSRSEKAEQLHRRALAIYEQVLGPDGPDVATSLRSLASLLRATRRADEAEPLIRRALKIDEAELGDTHPDLARDLTGLASVLLELGRESEAAPLYERALKISESVYGPDHPVTAEAMNNLAITFNQTRQFDKAESLYRRALAIDERTFGPDHPNVALGLNNLGEVQRLTKQFDQAEASARRAYQIMLRSKLRTGHEPLNFKLLRRNYYQILLESGPDFMEASRRLETLEQTTRKNFESATADGPATDGGAETADSRSTAPSP